MEDGREIFDEEANEIGNSTSGSGGLFLSFRIIC